jgi:flagellum-specific ATP synthase
MSADATSQRETRLDHIANVVARFAHSRELTSVSGVVSDAFASHYRVEGLSPFLKLGDCVRIGGAPHDCVAQVVRVGRDGALVKSFDNSVSVGLGARAERLGAIEIAPHAGWRGRVLNAFAEPIDDKGSAPRGSKLYAVDARPPQAMRRARVATPLRTGVRAIDCFTPLCAGQRIGVFAGSGVGKSTLLAMLARASGFDAVVVCLVGERGREVRDFLDESHLTGGGATITIVATGDESPMMRRLAPLTAMTTAEYFRDAGASVLLIVDSVTRYAHAAREAALAAGEPPVAHGFTPSVFADLPRLLERAGPGESGGGAITGIFSVLVDGDNHNDPIADCIRGTLDGHIVLERDIADQGRYPAINVLKSISRIADRVWSEDERQFVMRLRATLARFEDTRDLRMLGGYQPGADMALDRAVAAAPLVYEALTQSPQSPQSLNAMNEIAERLQGFAL